MKKVLFIAVIALLGLGSVNAQGTTFGVTAGFQNTTFTASYGGDSDSDSSQGYFAGIFADFYVSDSFHIQPEIHYSTIYEDDESLNELIIPIMVKYYVTEQFSVQAGPQLDYILEDDVSLSEFGVGIAIGAGFDFTEKIFFSTRYSFGINNRIDDAPSGVSAKLNFFQAGLGYRF